MPRFRHPDGSITPWFDDKLVPQLVDLGFTVIEEDAEPEQTAEAEDVKLCAGTKADGTPCTAKAKDSSDFCGRHEPKADEEE